VEAEIGRFTVPELMGQKSTQDSISTEKKLGVVPHICHPTYCGKHKKIGGL
jgi:hypothetical protein